MIPSQERLLVRIERREPPRRFTVKGVALSHVADVALEADEIVTFHAGTSEYDVTRKSWGYYATPSLNRRLPSFGLRPFLVRAADEAAFVMLVQDGHETAFQDYLRLENIRVIGCLSDPALLDRIDGLDDGQGVASDACALCGGRRWSVLAVFRERPDGETDFRLTPYERRLERCGGCGHIVNRHDMDISTLYIGQYWDATYGDRVHATFDRIMALPPERSDNRQRVVRVDAYMRAIHPQVPRKLLDIGTGLAVFPAAMAEAGWQCTALDPDSAAVRHAETLAGATGLCGDFLTLDLPERFGLITLNKVLEHVPDMPALLARCRSALVPGGAVYVEVPDGEAAILDSPAREEFFIEHLCAFSAASLTLLCHMAGFRLDRLERIREPSGKYTLYAFMSADV